MRVILTAVPAVVVVVCLTLFAIGIRAMRGDPVEGLDLDELLVRGKESRRVRSGVISRLVAPLVPSLRRAIGTGLEERLRRTVELAGRPDGMTVDTLLQRMLTWLAIVSPLLLLATLNGQWWVLPACAAAVITVPLAGVARTRRLRQERISRDLPDFLDVLAVTVTAGVGFRAALDTVAERFGGPLTEEVVLTMHQIRNGASVRDAFRRLRQRNDSEPLSMFVTAYLQAEELGAPLAATLNRIALDTRRDSGQRQRQRAAKAVPRVTLVTSVVLLPSALVLLVVGFLLGLDINLNLGNFTGTAAP